MSRQRRSVSFSAPPRASATLDSDRPSFDDLIASCHGLVCTQVLSIFQTNDNNRSAHVLPIDNTVRYMKDEDVTGGGAAAAPSSQPSWFCGIQLEGVRFIDNRMMETIHLLFTGQPLGTVGTGHAPHPDGDDEEEEEEDITNDDHAVHGRRFLSRNNRRGQLGYLFHNETGDLRCEVLFSLKLAERLTPRHGAAAMPEALSRPWGVPSRSTACTFGRTVGLLMGLGMILFVLWAILFGPPLSLTNLDLTQIAYALFPYEVVVAAGTGDIMRSSENANTPVEVPGIRSII